MVSRLGLSCAPVLKAPITSTTVITTPAIHLWSNRRVLIVIASPALQQTDISPEIFLLSKLTGADAEPISRWAPNGTLLERTARCIQTGWAAWLESVDGRLYSLLLRLLLIHLF